MKDGKHSSELWVGIGPGAAAIYSAIESTDTKVKITALCVAGAVSIAYMVCRTMVKRAKSAG